MHIRIYLSMCSFFIAYYLTLFILIDYSIDIDTISMEVSNLYSTMLQIKNSIKLCISAVKIVFIFANSANPDKNLIL